MTNNAQNAVLRVSTETFIYMGHQCCRSYDNLNIKPCFKFGRIGHFTSDSDGKSPNKFLIVLTEILHFNQNKCTNHIMTDAQNCIYSNYIINKKVNTTDYQLLSKIPNFQGFTKKK